LLRRVSFLTTRNAAHLAFSGKLITFETAFDLNDYLDGDVIFIALTIIPPTIASAAGTSSLSSAASGAGNRHGRRADGLLKTA